MTAVAKAEHYTKIALTKDTPYLALMVKLWGVNCEYFGENWPHYNGTELYSSTPWQGTPSHHLPHHEMITDIHVFILYMHHNTQNVIHSHNVYNVLRN